MASTFWRQALTLPPRHAAQVFPSRKIRLWARGKNGNDLKLGDVPHVPTPQPPMGEGSMDNLYPRRKSTVRCYLKACLHGGVHPQPLLNLEGFTMYHSHKYE